MCPKKTRKPNGGEELVDETLWNPDAVGFTLRREGYPGSSEPATEEKRRRIATPITLTGLRYHSRDYLLTSADGRQTWTYWPKGSKNSGESALQETDR